MRKWLLVILCGFLLCPVSAGAADTRVDDTILLRSDDQFQLAQTLFTDEEFSAAANEFVRFIYLFPKHSRVPEARYQAGLAFFNAGRLEDAVRHLKKAAFDLSSAKVAFPAMMKLSEIYVAAGKPGEGVLVLRNLLTLSSDERRNDHVYFTLGWLMLDHGDQIQAGVDYPVYPVKEARKYFSLISEEGKKHYNVQQIFSQLDGMKKINQKNPALAGWLSIVPGAGFLYGERYRDAAVSFLLNTALMLAAWQSFENDNPYLGGSIAFVESGFYTGNIYGAVSSAHKYNARQQQTYIEKMKSQQDKPFSHLSFQAKDDRMELALMFHYHF